MKRTITMALIGALVGCTSSQSFDFVLKDGDATQQVVSDGEVTGEVTNAGYFTLEDSSWALVMNLQGLAAGNHVITMNQGELQIRHKDAPDTYKTSLGGTCNVWINPHATRNGTVVTGQFDCTKIVSVQGKAVDVTNGSFQVAINDVANNPKFK